MLKIEQETPVTSVGAEPMKLYGALINEARGIDLFAQLRVALRRRGERQLLAGSGSRSGAASGALCS